MKHCPKCDSDKPRTIEFFSRSSQCKDGFYGWCKECLRAKWKERYPRIAKDHRKRNREYAIKNKEKVHAYRLKYYEDNCEIAKAKSKEWARKNKYKRLLNHKYSKAKHNAIRFGVKNTLTSKEIGDMLDANAGVCDYCNSKIDKMKLTIDHIIPMSRGGSNSLDNVLLSCLRCNMVKGVKPLEEFMKYMGIENVRRYSLPAIH